MKRTIGLAIVAAIITAPLFAVDQAPRPASKAHTAQYPQLMNLKSLSFVIDRAGDEPNNPLVNWSVLESKCLARLMEVGIQIETPAPTAQLNTPAPLSGQLHTSVTLIHIEQTKQYALHIQTSLYRLAVLPRNTSFEFLVPVWNSSSVMKVVSQADANGAINDTINSQFDAFMHAHHAASVAAQSCVFQDSRPAAIPASADGTPPFAPSHKDGKCLASKNSKVFHAATCPQASRITSANVITYASRSDAVAAGKRPCKMCNP